MQTQVQADRLDAARGEAFCVDVVCGTHLELRYLQPEMQIYELAPHGPCAVVRASQMYPNVHGVRHELRHVQGPVSQWRRTEARLVDMQNSGQAYCHPPCPVPHCLGVVRKTSPLRHGTYAPSPSCAI